MAKSKLKAKPDDPYALVNEGLPPKPSADEPTPKPKVEGPKVTTDDDLIKNLLRTHKEVPGVEIKDGADVLHVRTLKVLIRLRAGGMINPYASAANADVDALIDSLTRVVKKV